MEQKLTGVKKEKKGEGGGQKVNSLKREPEVSG